MKITRLYLKNFTGIYKGGGLKEIELNFDDKEIILLVGENGSGKTTILNALNPLPNSKAIRKNKDGIQEIEFEEGMVIYKVQHYYKATNKSHTVSSFMQKIVNGKIIELNENGNVTSFKQILESELGINDDYISLLQLGYSFNSFINKTTSERSKCISTFLSDISIYLKYYKKVNSDMSLLKKLVKNLSDKLSMIGEPDELKSKDTKIGILLDKITEDKEKQMSNILFLKKEIEELDIEEGVDIETDLDDKIIKTVFDNLKILNWSNIKLETFESIQKETFSSVSNKVDSINNNIKSMSNLISDYDDDIEDIESEIEIIDKNECDSIINKYKELSRLKIILEEEYGFNLTENIPKYTKESLFDAIGKLDEYLVAVEDIHGEFDRKIISEAIIMYSENKNVSLEYINVSNLIIKLKNDLSMLRGQISELNRSYEVVCANECKRPSKCEITNCPLIGGNKKEMEDTLDRLLREEEDIVHEIKQSEEKQIELEKYLKVYNQLKQINTAFNYSKAYFDGIPFIKNSFEEYLDVIDKCVPWYENNELDDCSDILDMYNKYIETKEALNNMQGIYTEALNELKNLEDKKVKLIKLKNSKSLYEQKLNTYVMELQEISERYGILKDMDENINTYIEVIKYKDNLDKIKKCSEKLKANKKEISKLNNYIKDIECRKEQCMKQKEKISHDLFMYNQYKEEKKLFTKKYKYVSLVRDALSTTKGIPLIFIDLYLEQARIIANDLLESTFGDKYKLDKFCIQDKEFRIPFLKNGEYSDDVSKGSEGEKSIFSLILSFSFIHQISSAFNIMFLDEVDGPLDKNNRKNFAYAIEKQMSIMGMEQLIIITHNDSFMNKNVGYVLLKGWDMDNINNSNIIYKY